MKNLSTMLAILVLIAACSSCKKEKNEKSGSAMGNYQYQGKTVNITLGDNRDTGVDGSWVYFSGEALTDFVQLRFPNTGIHVVPEGDFSFNGIFYDLQGYNPATNFNGGMVVSESTPGGDEITGGSVRINKDGESYNISFDVTTAKGSLKGSFSGKLKQI